MGYPVRIVDLDFYMSAPIEGLDTTYSKFRGSSISQVPILRLFGCNNEGKKICIHIHGVFPYLYIPYDGSQEANSLMYQIAALIDKSVNISLNQAMSHSQHVYKVSLVSGIPMYGYHTRPHQFFKIFLYNPIFIKKVSNLVMNKTTLGEVYQAHESHINFIMQFMIDFNLHGMSFMNISEIKFRKDVMKENTCIEEHMFLPPSIKKTTTCELEADILAQHIINREQVISGLIAANPGIECLWEDERHRRFKKGDHSEIKHLLELSRTNVEPTKSHLVFKQALRERLIMFSTEKNTIRDLNVSVYPAETPEHVQIQSASDNDSDITSSLELSLDDTLCDLDITMTSDSSMREDDDELFNILNKLGDNSDDLEDDSILSQAVKPTVDDGDLDMTLPLASDSVDKEIEQESDDEFNKTLIPQLDGMSDDHVFLPMKRRRKKLISENLLNIDPNNNSTKLYIKKALYIKIVRNESVEKLLQRGRVLTKRDVNSVVPQCAQTRKMNNKNRLERELKSIAYNVKKINKRNYISVIMKKLHQKEHQLRVFINEHGFPDFRVISKTALKDKERTQKKRALLLLDGACDSSSDDECFSPNFSTQGKKVASNSSSSGEAAQDFCKTFTDKDESTLNEMKSQINSTMIEETLACALTISGARKQDNIADNKSDSKRRKKETNDDYCQSLINSCSERSLESPNLNASSILEVTADKLNESFNADKFKEVHLNSQSLLGNSLNKTVISVHGNSVTNKPGVIILKPKKMPPTKEEVLNNLVKYKIPHIKEQVPFCSNIEDVTGCFKVGHNILKVNGQNTTSLLEFESQTDGLNRYRNKILQSLPIGVKDKKAALNNIILSYSKFDVCFLKPVKEPPTPKEVRKNLKLKQTKEKLVKKDQLHKTKLHVPLSLGSNADENMDMSLSLSVSSCSGISSSQNIEQKSECSDITLTDEQLQNFQHTNQTSSSTDSCLISGISVNDTFAFSKPTQDLQEVRAFIEHQYLTVLVMELHISTRGNLKPDPQLDSIQAIFYSVFNDVPPNNVKPSKYTGVVVNTEKFSGTHSKQFLYFTGISCDITYANNEETLFKEFSNIVNYWDPDIVAGYEIEMLSWGYFIERGAVLNINVNHTFGRNSLVEPRRKNDNNSKELKLIGRIVLDVWRLMRHEIALQSYTFESIVYHILHKRVPYYAFKTLTLWWNHDSNLYRRRTVNYYLLRVEKVLELLEKLDFINRTSELARLFGILFFEVLSRGSQFRVESMMLRLAKPLNFIPVSPSIQQRGHMKAPEYIPLVLEPESKLYNDPVIVLDFQSLYPSIIIAYNYCFTTCIGRVECLGKNGPFEFGATQLKISKKKLEKLSKRDLLNFSPCGVGYVKKSVRDGILPRMLREILDTRLMVKNSMKENKADHNLQKVLHSRQLGLKLIANVTYGYTSANFSGRMPSVEVADSVVSKGRELLQRAIEIVDSNTEWGARVVYGDTDSLFVLVPGRNREYAFEVGAKIVDAVAKSNPDPVKLKLEKVYQPCILQTKKRYVGYMYESPDQKEPVYEAKGIETVRRDGIPATTKMLEKCLRLLFETKDVSLVKKYVLKQFSKILTGRASIQDLTFAKEYRGASGYQPGACVPALELARTWFTADKRSEPRSGERVPYVIVSGPPDVPLIRLVRSPRDLLNDCFLKPHAVYYITKAIIPAINRCFNLIGIDLFTWYNEMQRKKSHYFMGPTSPEKKSTIAQYFSTTNCFTCGVQTQERICQCCSRSDQLQTTTITLVEKLKMWEENFHNCMKICQSCTGVHRNVRCESLDCPVLYRRVQTDHDLKQESYVRQLIPVEF